MRLGLNGRFLAVPTTGVQRFAREVGFRVLESSGVEGVLFLPGGVEAPRDLGPEVEVISGLTSGYPWEQVELPWRARRAGANLVLNLANTVPRAGGLHLVVVHDVLPLTDPQWFGRGFRLAYRWIQVPAIRRARAVVTVSEWSREEIVRVLGIPAAEIRVVSQGVAPFDAPAPPEAVSRVVARLGLPDRYLLTVGGRDPRKNVPFLKRALGVARDRGVDVPPLVVVGRASPPGRGRRVETDASEDVRFTGYLGDGDLAALYTSATLFCYPSLAEGFGRPPLEAMGCGTPVLASDYGPAREVLADGARILPWDVGAWVEALEELLADETDRKELARRGTIRARSFSWDASAEAVLKACRELVGPGRVPTRAGDARGAP